MKYLVFYILIGQLTMQLFMATADALDSKEIEQQLMGNFNYLIESQVNCADELAAGKYICDKETPGERRILGTWDAHIIPLIIKKNYPLRIVDSNMFVTAHTVFPLFFLRFLDPNLEGQRLDAVYRAMQAINLFKRNGAFAFWPEIGPSRAGQVNRIGPLNLSPLLLMAQLKLIDKVQNFFHFKLYPQNLRYLEKNIDLENNELGMDALFSVPNDADDTALGIVSNYYFYQDQENSEGLQEYLDMTQLFAGQVDSSATRKDRRYRDYLKSCKKQVLGITNEQDRQRLFQDEQFLKKCSLDDPRESWRYSAYENKYSGAFLTWLYDEKAPIYDQPEKGVFLTGQNSVDCNVLANVLYSLSLTEKRQDPNLRPGYLNSCNAITNTILDADNKLFKTPSPRKIDIGETSVWKYCGLYYPAHMTFPYLISKAVSEANACQDLNAIEQKRFDIAMDTLLEDIIQEQDLVDKNKAAGQWYEKIDKTLALSTALGGVSLLNFLNSYGERLTQGATELQTRVELAIKHTLNLSELTNINGKETSSLPEGTFFGGGTVKEIAHWRSKPFATSVSLELMSKYLMKFGDARVEEKKLVIPLAEDAISSPHTTEQREERTLENKNQQDSLPVLTEAKIKFKKMLGIQRNFNQRRADGSEIIIGIELSQGEHLAGAKQVEQEEVAYYKIKLNSGVGLNLSSGNLESYHLQAKFLGIHTKVAFVIDNEFAYLPISYVKTKNIDIKSAHLAYFQMNAPIFQIENKGRVNIAMTGKFLGFLQKSIVEGNLPHQRQSYNLADLDLGFSYKQGKAAAQMTYQTALGLSENDRGERYSSHQNHGIKAAFTYTYKKHHRLSFILNKQIEGGKNPPFDDDQGHLKYEYHWY